MNKELKKEALKLADDLEKLQQYSTNCASDMIRKLVVELDKQKEQMSDLDFKNRFQEDYIEQLQEGLKSSLELNKAQTQRQRQTNPLIYNTYKCSP